MSRESEPNFLHHVVSDPLLFNLFFQLTNMIWGDEGETDDHIVPFKVRNRKEQGDESNKAVKPAESKTHLHDSKLGGSSSGQNIECMSSWPDSSVSNARKADPGPGSSEPARYDSTRSGAFLETVLFYLGTFFQILIMFKVCVCVCGRLVFTRESV